MKTILITGINGFLGSNLAKILCNEYKVIGIEYSIKNLYRLKSYYFKVYSSSINLEDIFKENKIYAIIHAATLYRRDNTESFEALIETNILLPVKLYELANMYNCEIFLNTDSFFNSPEYNYSYLPDYTLTKKQVIEWLSLIQKTCKLVNMKVFHMYGPGDNSNKFIPSLIEKISNNFPSIDLTPGDQKRDFIFIEDVVSAFQYVLGNSEKCNFSEFQIGTGNATSIKMLLNLIKEITKSNSNLNFGSLDYRKNEIMFSVANINNLKELGWLPKNSLKQGLIKTIQKTNL